MLTGDRAAAHDPGASLGYELTGNAALFKGDYKLVRNLAPTGDGSWHLYNIVRDPGETHDLAAIEPARFRDMQADYAAYAKRDQVLPMPPGYTADKQINRNAFYHTALPKLMKLGAIVLLGLGLIVGLVVTVRRRRAA